MTLYHDPSNRNGKPESPRPGAPRIDIEDTRARFENRTMRMARHHDPDAACKVLTRQCVQVMQHIDADTVDIDDSRLRDGLGPAPSVIVSADWIDWCDRREICKDAFMSDIPGVNDKR